MTTLRTAQTADFPHSDAAHLPSARAVEDQLPVRGMEPLPPPSRLPGFYALVTTDPLSSWVFGLACGIALCVFAAAVGVGLI